MNFYFIKKTLFVCLYFIIFVFFRDILYALLIRFFDHWISSFIILPSITLAILLIIKIYINRFDFTYLNVIKVDFIFLIKVLFMCVSLYVFSASDTGRKKSNGRGVLIVYLKLNNRPCTGPRHSRNKRLLLTFELI